MVARLSVGIPPLNWDRWLSVWNGYQQAAGTGNALMVLPSNAETVAAILDAKSLTDSDAQVRLAALLALADVPENRQAAEATAVLLSEPSLPPA